MLEIGGRRCASKPVLSTLETPFVVLMRPEDCVEAVKQ